MDEALDEKFSDSDRALMRYDEIGCHFWIAAVDSSRCGENHLSCDRLSGRYK